MLDMRKKQDRLFTINKRERKATEWRKNLRRVESFKNFQPRILGEAKIIKIEYVLFTEIQSLTTYNLELGKYNSLNDILNAYEAFKENEKIVGDNSFFRRIITFKNEEYDCIFTHHDLSVNLSERDIVFEKCVLNRYLY